MLKVERNLSRYRLIEGDDIDISLKIHNNSTFQTHIIELEDQLFQEFEVIKGSNIFMFSLFPNEQIILKYSVKCHQFGKYTFDTINIRHRDFLGITINEFSLDHKSMPLLSHKIAVVPKIEKIETLPVISDWLRHYSGIWNSEFLGNDTDFRGIREFVYGDSLRHINWKTTARFQASTKHSLFSNSYNWDRAIDVEIILDATYSIYPVWNSAIRAVTSIAEFLIRTRNKIGLTIIRQYPEYIRPGVGKKQLRIITDKILDVGDPEEYIDHIMMELRFVDVLSKKYKPKSLIIFISPFIDASVLKFPLHLRRRNFNIVAITPMTLTKQEQGVLNDPNIDYNIKTPVLHSLVSFNLMLDQQTINNTLKNNLIQQIEWYTKTTLSTSFVHTKYVRRRF